MSVYWFLRAVLDRPIQSKCVQVPQFGGPSHCGLLSDNLGNGVSGREGDSSWWHSIRRKTRTHS